MKKKHKKTKMKKIADFGDHAAAEITYEPSKKGRTFTETKPIVVKDKKK